MRRQQIGRILASFTNYVKEILQLCKGNFFSNVRRGLFGHEVAHKAEPSVARLPTAACLQCPVAAAHQRRTRADIVRVGGINGFVGVRLHVAALLQTGAGGESAYR